MFQLAYIINILANILEWSQNAKTKSTVLVGQDKTVFLFYYYIYTFDFWNDFPL